MRTTFRVRFCSLESETKLNFQTKHQKKKKCRQDAENVWIRLSVCWEERLVVCVCCFVVFFFFSCHSEQQLLTTSCPAWRRERRRRDKTGSLEPKNQQRETTASLVEETGLGWSSAEGYLASWSSPPSSLRQVRPSRRNPTLKLPSKTWGESSLSRPRKPV